MNTLLVACLTFIYEPGYLHLFACFALPACSGSAFSVVVRDNSGKQLGPLFEHFLRGFGYYYMQKDNKITAFF